MEKAGIMITFSPRMVQCTIKYEPVQCTAYMQHGLMTYPITVDENYSFIQAGGGVGICSAIKTSDVMYNNCV